MFLCDQPYERGHKCSSPTTQLFLVEVLGDEEDGTAERSVFTGEVEFEEEKVVPQISINTYPGFNAMRVNGHKGKKILHILIDSGRTHNFLDESVVKKFGCRLEAIAEQSVAIADGTHCRASSFVEILHGPCMEWSLSLISYFYP